jgi:hypothetical protein
MQLFLKMNLVLALFLLNQNAFAQNGLCAFDNVTLDSLSCSGKAMLNGTSVKGETVVDGYLSAQRVTISSLNVRGVTEISSSTVSGKVEIYGPLFMKNVLILGHIFVASPTVKIEKSRINSTMRIQSKKETPKVTVTHNTKIKEIIFEGKPGIVIIDDTCSVYNVVNGTVEKK